MKPFSFPTLRRCHAQAATIVAIFVLTLVSRTAAAGEGELETTSLKSEKTSVNCSWWNGRLCPGDIEGLPPEAPRQGTVITVDTNRNTLYLFRDGVLVAKSPAATGSNKTLRNGLDVWLFRTPHGRVTVQGKIVDPIWTKPDWAFVEEGKPIPPLDSPKRKVAGKMGRYALDLGDGILIHGTDDPSSIGKSASHGCIRLPDAMLKKVFSQADVGTEVYVF